MNTIIKRVLAFILSFALIFATTARANAVTSVGGWTATDSLIAGANTTINATKTAGGKVLKSAITIAPQAGKVGKYLLRGGAAGALALAVPQIIGEGVEWVLDPANNSISYIDTGAGSNVNNGFCATGKYCAPTGLGVANNHAQAILVSEQCQSVSLASTLGPFKNSNGSFGFNYAINCIKDGKTIRFGTYGATAPANYEDNQPVPTTKHIPIDTVAAKVISNAEAGHAPSQEAVKATALEGFAAGEHDAALEAAATEAGTENPPDTENPPKDPDAPAEPFDPAGIISAINALKALLAGILSSITSLSDFFQSDPPPEPKPEDTQLDIPIPDVVPVDTDINFGGSCPANFEFNGSMFGNPINIVLLDTSKFCGFLSTFVKFPVYAASSLFALYILGGRKDV